MGLRDKIFAANDKAPLKINVPEWDCDLYLRVMTVGERTEFRKWAQENADKKLGKAVEVHLVTLCCCDETGAPIFTAADEPQLLAKSGAVLDRLGLEIIELNCLSDASIEAARKNSKQPQS